MRDSLEAIKPRVRDMRAYSLTPERARVKINQNENAWDAPRAIKRETLRRVRTRAWSRYPDFTPDNLRASLAAFAGWKPDGILVGNGSNELIQALLMVTVGENKQVMICEPTFALYRQIATVLGGDVVSVPLNSDFGYDARAMLEVCAARQPDVTIICSPNNPTGCVIDEASLIALLEKARGLVVIDEAYFEFAGQSLAPLLERHANLIVLRTFSKAMAMAALRVGYLLAAPALAREIGKAMLPYNLNAISQEAALVAVEMYDEHLRPPVARIIAERERLFAELSRIEGLAPVPSKANFIIVRSETSAPRLMLAELLRRGILARDVSGYPMLKDYFRVSVGTPEENDFLIHALKEIV